MQQFDQFNIFSIPDPSSNVDFYHRNNLRAKGILNDGNVCAHISLLLCLHKIGAKEYIVEPNEMMNRNGRDFASMALLKVLRAMPSVNAFSLQLLISTWNNIYEGVFRMQPYDDIFTVADGIISSLKLKQTTRPLFTKFNISYTCQQCHRTENNISQWNSKLFQSVPIINIMRQSTKW